MRPATSSERSPDAAPRRDEVSSLETAIMISHEGTVDPSVLGDSRSSGEPRFATPIKEIPSNPKKTPVEYIPSLSSTPVPVVDDNTSSSTRQKKAPRKGSLARSERKDLDLPPLLFGKLLAGLLQGGKEEKMSARRLLLQRQERERCRPAIAIRRLRSRRRASSHG
ncbi:hypothetical protein L1887_63477 [Cichorium endivia]|nr:hypothetical protein L1887_63477 [Cichorium endivia]